MRVAGEQEVGKKSESVMMQKGISSPADKKWLCCHGSVPADFVPAFSTRSFFSPRSGPKCPTFCRKASGLGNAHDTYSDSGFFK